MQKAPVFNNISVTNSSVGVIAAFDVDLKRRDARWGVRDLNALVSEAAPYGRELRAVEKMPANNLSLVFVKTSGGGGI